MRATETIYREMLTAYAKRRGGQLQEDCDLSVRHRSRRWRHRRNGCWGRAFHRQLQGSIWTATEPCEASSDRHPAGRPVS